METQTNSQPLLIVGSIALDTVKTPFGTASEVLGGAAVYSSMAASFYSQVRVVGVVGSDFPEQHLQTLRERKIDLDGVQIKEGKTFRWSGYYEYDLSQAHTVSTEVNVFQDFQPAIPSHYRDTPYVFLANIDPSLQLSVLEQMARPKLVACDTMDYWITGKREELMEVLKRVNLVIINEAEARQLCDISILGAAAQKILSWGPEALVIKQGEHGALLFTESAHFSAPGYPLEELKDPTGAGDSFAGGLMGYLAYTDNTEEENLRKAVIYGSVMASFDVEDFSLGRLASLSPDEIGARYREFKEISYFE